MEDHKFFSDSPLLLWRSLLPALELLGPDLKVCCRLMAEEIYLTSLSFTQEEEPKKGVRVAEIMSYLRHSLSVVGVVKWQFLNMSTSRAGRDTEFQ